MRDFETGMHYLRKTALRCALIQESDNDGTLVKRIARLIASDAQEEEVAPVVVEEEVEEEEVVEEVEELVEFVDVTE